MSDAHWTGWQGRDDERPASTHIPQLRLASCLKRSVRRGPRTRTQSVTSSIRRAGRCSRAISGLLNPLRMTAENLPASKRLYNENCAFCHGPTGEGDGEVAADLDPVPSRLTDMYERPMLGMGQTGPGGHLMHGVPHHHPGMTHAEAMGGLNLDAYTYWAVSEGGEPMGGSMPAFKEILSDEERWQILALHRQRVQRRHQPLDDCFSPVDRRARKRTEVSRILINLRNFAGQRPLVGS